MKIKLAQGKAGTPTKPAHTAVVVPVQPESAAPPHGVLPEFKHRVATALGVFHLVFGLLVLVISIILYAKTRTCHGFITIPGVIVVIITGSLGLAAARKKTRRLIIAFLVFSIIALFMAFFGTMGSVKIAVGHHRGYDRDHKEREKGRYKRHGMWGGRRGDNSKEHDDQMKQWRGRYEKKMAWLAEQKQDWSKRMGIPEGEEAQKKWWVEHAESWEKEMQSLIRKQHELMSNYKQKEYWRKKMGRKDDDDDDDKKRHGRYEESKFDRKKHRSAMVAHIVMLAISVMEFIASIVSCVICGQVVGCCRKRQQRSTSVYNVKPSMPLGPEVSPDAPPQELSPKLLDQQAWLNYQPSQMDKMVEYEPETKPAKDSMPAVE